MRPQHGTATKGGELVYEYLDGLYLNLTNRCPVSCSFCVKGPWKWSYRGWDLRLAREPSAGELLEAAARAMAGRSLSEAVFCGYGEPTLRLPVMAELSRELRKDHPRLRLRLNTIGLGSLIWGRDIVPELKVLDSVSVSLNTADPGQWLRLHRPLKPYREKGFESVLDFIRGCARCGLETTVTAVDLPAVDLAAVRRLAESLGAGFRIRPYLP